YRTGYSAEAHQNSLKHPGGVGSHRYLDLQGLDPKFLGPRNFAFPFPSKLHCSVSARVILTNAALGV
uniref:Uncharacterized protein n=1 Tax=Scleropages formosus TaxID=113540 RepID=A0A8C9T3B9_SCLFO